MANHINGRLYLEGPVDEIARLKAHLLDGHKDWYEQETLNFNAIVPMPADIPEDEVVEWQIENWGCKWGAEGLDDRNCDDTLIDVFFSTPNSGAHGVMKAIAEQFPLLSGWYACGEWANDWCCHSDIGDGKYEEGEEDELDAEMAQTLDIPWEDEGDEDDEDGEFDGEEETV